MDKTLFLHAKTCYNGVGQSGELWGISFVSKASAMFLGEYEHTIDAKARLAVPAKFRAQINHGAVLSKGMGTCLSVYTVELWERKSNELASGMSSEELRDFERRIYPSASEVELDAQGRMVIPAKLRVYAGLESEVTVAGVRDHFEIWDRATWQAYQERLGAGESNIPF
ncbi:MAG TPA: division/cell wall cluster transcriptional repressor MraZ [Ktedonobacteraceae bacterium]|nr:division/cell wall cluster transcriptional repressor MraZ [Ktedonobacteraceae bacterium]